MRVLPADYVVMVIYMVTVIALGVYVSNQGGNLRNMMVAGGQVGLYSLAASFIATEWSAVSLFFQNSAGNPEALGQLFSAWTLAFAFITIGFLGLSTVLPRRKKAVTAGELLGQCYGKTARVIFGILMTGVYILLLGMLLKSFSTMFSVFFGTSPGFMMIIMVCVTALYTVSGGMWAVILTDYIQIAILGIMVPVSAFFSIKAAGGFEQLFEDVFDAGAKAAPAAVTFFSDTGAAAIFVKFLIFLCIALCFPSLFSRTFSARSVSTAYKGFIIGAVSLIGCSVFSVVIAAASVVVSPNLAGAAAYAKTMMVSIPKGLTGLLIVAMMGAFMSACSSYYLAVGSMLSRDIAAQIMPVHKKSGGTKGIFLLRMGIVLSAGLSFVIAYTLLHMEALFEIVAVITVSGGAACILFGLYWKRARKAGAIGAFFAGGLFYFTAYYVFQAGYNVLYGGTIASSFLAMILLSLLASKNESGNKKKRNAEAVL